MSRVWCGREPQPVTDTATTYDGHRVTVPRVTVPPPAHTRLRDALIEIYGLDYDCSDDRIIAAALEHTSTEKQQ